MLQDPLTLYKLIVLYMLNRVTFPLTAAQVSDFILGKEYTNFLTLQQVINELTDAGMIATQSIRNRTHLSITPEGKETLNFFENRIGDTIKQEIDTYFRENEFTLRNEVSFSWRGRRDLNPRAGFPTYSLSRGAPSPLGYFRIL